MEEGQAPTGESSVGAVLSKRYVLKSSLGRGAFGTTYLARDSFLDRLVVVKLLAAEEKKAFSLFEKEVQVTSSLQHQGIISIVDVGISDDGRPYYVTPWVKGNDLASVLRVTGALGRHRAAQVASGIGEVLDYVHSSGFIHRDIKPSNILIPDRLSGPDFRNPKILDFGIAGSLSAGRTKSGMVFGTPRYMAPEQITGQSQSPATDIYGLGLLLFETLAGRPLWDSAETPEALFRAILGEEFADNDFDAIPADFAILIRRCLHRDPSKRPSAKALLDQLGRLDALTPSVGAESAPVEVPFARSEGFSSAPPWLNESRAELTAAAYVPAWRRPLIWFALLGNRLRCLVGYVAHPGYRALWVWAAALMLTGLIAVVTALAAPQRMTLGPVALAALLWMIGSIALGFWLRGWLGRRSSAQAGVYELAAGAKRRVDLTATIALQLDDLVCNLRALDERILAGSVALMLEEYNHASDAKDRQSALMNVVALSEKLAQRLSPWYVRYKDVIASAVAIAGAVSALITAYNVLRGQHKP